MLKSSTTVKKYEWSWQDFMAKGPHTSKCTTSKGFFALLKIELYWNLLYVA